MSIVLHVPPTAFDPQPKVESCIVKFVPYAQPLVKVNDPELLQSIVTEAFNQRRKNIANSLKNFITADELKNLQIDTQARAENLSLEQYAIITNYLNAK